MRRLGSAIVLLALGVGAVSLDSALGQTSGKGAAQPAATAAAKTAADAARRTRLQAVGSWAYQLQRIEPEHIARSPFDLAVIDYSRSGSDRGRFRPAEVERMQRKPDGSARIMLAYMSVGEAEAYRFYWQDGWVEPIPPGPTAAPGAADALERQPGTPAAARHRPTLSAPSWLGAENENWARNYAVKYWEKDWQDLMVEYLERIVRAGFDGVYLDRVDEFDEHREQRPTAPKDMIDFVVKLARHARTLKPDFMVVVQNGEELLKASQLVAEIDAFAKEDLFYGFPSEGEPNPARHVAASLALIRIAERAGLPILVVEYLDKPDEIAAARARILGRGFLPYFAPRLLDRLVLPAELAVDERRRD